MPEAIVASTEQCDVVSIDARSGISTTLWEYSRNEETFLDCTDQGLEHLGYTGAEEIFSGFIRDVEWVHPNFVLLSMCCFLTREGFELLDIEMQMKRYWRPLSISYTSINDQRMLMVGNNAIRGAAMTLIGSTRRSWDVGF